MPRREPITAADAPPRATQGGYPEPFAARIAGRLKRPLGDLFGLTSFGVNHTRLAPGAMSALCHHHSRQDELVYVISGTPTLITGDHAECVLQPGMCVGFQAGHAVGHCLVNRTDEDVMLLEVGSRTPGDRVAYPDDDLEAEVVDGAWVYTHKDGQPY